MANTYKPGDRVQYDSKQQRRDYQLQNGSVGTIESAPDHKLPTEFVRMDGSAGTFLIGHEYLTRQPVEPGCYVRWTDEAVGKLNTTAGWPVHKHRVLNVERASWSDRDVITFEAVPELVYLSDVVRVADPELTPVSQPEPAPVEFFVGRSNGGFDAKWHVLQHHVDGTPPRFPPHIVDTIGPFPSSTMAESVCKVLKGAADTAIRVMTDMQGRIDTLINTVVRPDDLLETAKLVDKLGTFLVENKHVPETSPTIRNPVDDAIKLITEQASAFTNLDRMHSHQRDTITRMLKQEKSASELLEHLITATNNAVDPNRLIGIREGLPARLDQLGAIIERHVISQQAHHYLICNNAGEWSYTNTKPAADTRVKIFGPILKHETCEALIRVITTLTGDCKSLLDRNQRQSRTIDEYMSTSTTAERLQKLLDSYDQPKPHQFKRGQQVSIRPTGDQPKFIKMIGRIITPMNNEVTYVDVMTESGQFYLGIGIDRLTPVE